MVQIESIVKIARDAGSIIMEIYHATAEIVYDRKDDDSPLTAADSQANSHICAELEKLALGYPIVSEENKSIPFSERSQFGKFWMVDPLDGTKEFIKRNGEFTVNIALIENGEPILGVVFAPALEEMYWGIKGKGAFWEKAGQQTKLQAPSFSLDEKGLGIVCSRSHLNEATEKFIQDYQEPNLVSKGSSLKFLMLAKGEAHLYPRVAPTMEWDTAAAHIVLTEAGGQLLQFDNGKPLEYNKENLLNPFFIAYGNVNQLKANTPTE